MKATIFPTKNVLDKRNGRQQYLEQKTYLAEKNFWRQQFIKQTGSIDVSWRKTSEGSNLSNRKTYLTGKNGRQHFLEKNAYLAEKNYWRQQFIKNNSLLGLKHLKTAVYPPKNVFDQKKIGRPQFLDKNASLAEKNIEGSSLSKKTRLTWPKKLKAAIYPTKTVLDQKKPGRPQFLDKNASLAEKNIGGSNLSKKLGLLGLKKLTATIYPTKNVLDQKQLEGRSFSTRTHPWPKKKLKAASYQKN